MFLRGDELLHLERGSTGGESPSGGGRKTLQPATTNPGRNKKSGRVHQEDLEGMTL